MDLFESDTHSFVVRIWLEETAEETGRTVLRGHITHVPSGERRYFQDLCGISRFIISYLENMGVSKCRLLLTHWLSHWRSKAK